MSPKEEMEGFFARCQEVAEGKTHDANSLNSVHNSLDHTPAQGGVSVEWLQEAVTLAIERGLENAKTLLTAALAHRRDEKAEWEIVRFAGHLTVRMPRMDVEVLFFDKRRFRFLARETVKIPLHTLAWNAYKFLPTNRFTGALAIFPDGENPWEHPHAVDAGDRDNT